MSLTALIFDLDGVIADTTAAHDAGWALVARELGVTVPPEMYLTFRGRRRGDILNTMTGRTLTNAEIDAVMPIKVSHYDQFLETMTSAHILPGVDALLKNARAHGLRLAVASSSYNAVAVLHRLGLYHRFDAVADGVTVTRAKPHPDIFIWAAGALRARPADCMVFEDAEAGVAAAKIAGMRVVGVGDARLVGAADMVVPTLVDFPLESL